MMSVSKKDRFEVFKRDSFTCQYCGRSAPDVILQIDHIHPRAKGGDDDLLNLVTSCRDCNAGKSDRLLSDDAIIQRRKSQLDDLQERREQLDMMLEWHKSLIDLDTQTIAEVAKFWDGLVPGYELNENGLDCLKRYVRKFGLNEVLEAMRIAADQYLKYGEGEDIAEPTKQSVEKAFNYVPRICTTRQRERDKPHIKDLYYIRGILRNRLSYVNEWQAIQLMEQCLEADVSIEDMRDVAKQVTSWTQFKDQLNDLMCPP